MAIVKAPNENRIYTANSGVEVSAFQWLGDPHDETELPGWARTMAIHAPQDQSLHVQCQDGTFAARAGDWVWQEPDGTVHVSKDSTFSFLFNTNVGDDAESTSNNNSSDNGDQSTSRSASGRYRKSPVLSDDTAKNEENKA